MTTCKECGAQITKGKELLHARWHGAQDWKPATQPIYYWYRYPPAIPYTTIGRHATQPLKLWPDDTTTGTTT
ncbi:MAG: hypothetical protein V3W06_09135 [Acidimicrobiia bacterium]